MRLAIAQPCAGSSDRIFRMRRSSVPWTRSVGLAICLDYLQSETRWEWICSLANRKARHSAAKGGLADARPSGRGSRAIVGPELKPYCRLMWEIVLDAGASFSLVTLSPRR